MHRKRGRMSLGSQVKGILYLGLPGQGGAEAVYHLLTGQTNPIWQTGGNLAICLCGCTIFENL